MRSADGRAVVRVLAVLAVCWALGAPVPARAQWRERGGRWRDPDGRDVYRKYEPKLLAAFREVVAEPSRCTVRVLCGGKEAALGTVVGADGWVLTKASEVWLAEERKPKGKVVCRLRDGRDLEARVVGLEEAYDLLLLKVEAKGLTPVEWRPSTTAVVGNWVATPGAGADPLAVGVVSVATRKLPARRNGRGPQVAGGFLGVMVQPGDAGVTVREVVPQSAAWRAGLKTDDVILSLAGKKIADVGAVPSTLRGMKPGAVVQIRVQRGNKELELQAKLGRRPLTQGEFQNELGGPPSEHRTGFPTVLQHDTALRPADCGGPLVDLDGKAVGVNIARAGRTESYAVPAEVVQRLLPDLKSGKLAPRLPKGEADKEP
jgi:serine protease Do